MANDVTNHSVGAGAVSQRRLGMGILEYGAFLRDAQINVNYAAKDTSTNLRQQVIVCCCFGETRD